MLGSCVRDREARAHGQGRELIDRVAAGAPVRKLLFVEALGHARVPFAGYRPDHRAGVELAAIDAHRAAEAAADLEGGFDDRVAREARRDRFEIGDFPGRTAARHSVPPRWSGRRVGSALYGGERPAPHVYCAKNGVSPPTFATWMNRASARSSFPPALRR